MELRAFLISAEQTREGPRGGFEWRKNTERGRFFERGETLVYVAPYGVAVVLDDGTIDPFDGVASSDRIELDWAAEGWAIRQGRVMIAPGRRELLYAAMIALAQSAGLEQYERRSESVWRQSGQIGGIMSGAWLMRRRLYTILRRASAIRREVLGRLALFDKPEAAWESDEADAFYRALAVWLELAERHEALELKMGLLRDEARVVIRLLHNQTAELQSVLIIVLIVLAILIEAGRLL